MNFPKAAVNKNVLIWILISLVFFLISVVCLMFLKNLQLKQDIILNQEALSLLLQQLEIQKENMIRSSITNVELISETTPNTARDGLALFLTVILVWVFFFSSSPPDLPELLLTVVEDSSLLSEARRAYFENSILFKKNLHLQAQINELVDMVYRPVFQSSLNTVDTVTQGLSVIDAIV